MSVIKGRPSDKKRSIQHKTYAEDDDQDNDKNTDSKVYHVRSGVIRGAKSTSKVTLPHQKIESKPDYGNASTIEEESSISPDSDLHPLDPDPLASDPSQEDPLDQFNNDMEPGLDTPQMLEDYSTNKRAEIDKEIESYRNEVFAQIDQEKQQLLEQAYQEGFNQGNDEANRILKESSDDMAQAINDLGGFRTQLFGHAKDDILALSLKAAEQIIQGEISQSPDVVLKIIDEAITRITDTDKVIIVVNPSELKTVREHRDAILDRMPDIKNLTIQEDEKVLPGGCMIETAMGYLDARINTKLKNLMKAFSDIQKEEKLEKEAAEHPPLDLTKSSSEHADSPPPPSLSAPAAPEVEETSLPEVDPEDDVEDDFEDFDDDDFDDDFDDPFGDL